MSRVNVLLVLLAFALLGGSVLLGMQDQRQAARKARIDGMTKRQAQADAERRRAKVTQPATGTGAR